MKEQFYSSWNEWAEEVVWIMIEGTSWISRQNAKQPSFFFSFFQWNDVEAEHRAP